MYEGFLSTGALAGLTSGQVQVQGLIICFGNFDFIDMVCIHVHVAIHVHGC